MEVATYLKSAFDREVLEMNRMRVSMHYKLDNYENRMSALHVCSSNCFDKMERAGVLMSNNSVITNKI